MWLNEEPHKNISSNDSKEHHGIQNCNTFQEPFHYKEVAFKRNYPARSTSDARNYILVNEIWLPDPTVLPSQDIPAENLLYQSRNKKVTTSSSLHGSENGYTADLLCTLVREQAAPQVTIELFDGNPLNFSYFLSMFPESVQKNIEDPMGRLIRLIKCTTGEAQELGKHFINDKPKQGYRNAMELLRRRYGNLHRLLAAYRMEMKHMSPIKPGDISAFRKLFNFLIKCQSLSRSNQNNSLATPEIFCMILSKLPVHLQDRWGRNTLKVRRFHSRESQLFDMANFVKDEKVGNRCTLCNENHDIEDCVFFLQQTLEERSKLPYKRKLLWMF